MKRSMHVDVQVHLLSCLHLDRFSNHQMIATWVSTSSNSNIDIFKQNISKAE